MCCNAEGNFLIDLSGFPEVMELNSEIDGSSPPINIPGGLIFGRDIVNTAYVSVIHYFRTSESSCSVVFAT